MSTNDNEALRTLIKTLLDEREAHLSAVIKQAVVEGVASATEFYNNSIQLNRIDASLNDLTVAVSAIQKTPKAPSSKSGASAKAAGAASGAAATTGGAAATTAPASKLNIMQFSKQILSSNMDLVHEYEAKITEKDPKEIDTIKASDTITNKKSDTEKAKAYAGELYKAIKERYPDLMKDLRSRHEKSKTEQQKEEHPDKLEADAAPAEVKTAT